MRTEPYSIIDDHILQDLRYSQHLAIDAQHCQIFHFEPSLQHLQLHGHTPPLLSMTWPASWSGRHGVIPTLATSKLYTPRVRAVIAAASKICTIADLLSTFTPRVKDAQLIDVY